MKCHILFSEKNKKNISKCRLLKILPRVLSVKLKSNSLTVKITTYYVPTGDFGLVVTISCQSLKKMMA